MLVDQYKEVSDISFSELERIQNKVKDDLLLIGGWAAYHLCNDKFKEWKKTDYIGSRDIDFGIKSEDLASVTKQLKKLGYTPLNFRFYKIFDRKSKKPISIEEGSKKPQFDLFYLYVDLILNKKIITKTTFFSDPLIGYCFDHDLWVKKDRLKIMIPEAFVLMKLRILKDRDKEKRIKDLLDCIFVANFSNFDRDFFDEMKQVYKIQKPSAISNIVNSFQVSAELKGMRLDEDEIRNIKTAFLGIL